MTYHPRTVVKISNATGDAALQYTMEAAEALYDRIGNDYLVTIANGLARTDPKIIRLCTRHMLRDTDMTTDDILDAVPLGLIAGRILDAIMLQKVGKPYGGHRNG